MSSVMYTGGSGWGPICDFASDQIRENKGRGAQARTASFSFGLGSPETTLHLISLSGEYAPPRLHFGGILWNSESPER